MSISWEQIQANIWKCNACKSHPRVELNIRQQTGGSSARVRLLVVTIAPPFANGAVEKTVAKSATNSPDDNVRRFLEKSLDLNWDQMNQRGLYLLHAVKCAITIKNGYQNPPNEVVDTCAPIHFAQEFMKVRPAFVITLGQVPRRAVIRIPGLTAPPQLGISKPLQGEFELVVGSHRFRLYVSRFIRPDSREQVRTDLRKAALAAGIL
jgi:uracil-DNA glycosylase